jgi:hypothetical protein
VRLCWFRRSFGWVTIRRLARITVVGITTSHLIVSIIIINSPGLHICTIISKLLRAIEINPCISGGQLTSLLVFFFWWTIIRTHRRRRSLCDQLVFLIRGGVDLLWFFMNLGVFRLFSWVVFPSSFLWWLVLFYYEYHVFIIIGYPIQLCFSCFLLLNLLGCFLRLESQRKTNLGLVCSYSCFFEVQYEFFWLHP